MWSKCRFAKDCRLYGNCKVCNYLGGYAFGGRPGGCYRDLSRNGFRSSYFRRPVRPNRLREFILTYNKS
jgi:hypothetical protein